MSMMALWVWMYLDGTPRTTDGMPSFEKLNPPASVPPLVRTVTW